jgi:hypothetical protein
MIMQLGRLYGWRNRLRLVILAAFLILSATLVLLFVPKPQNTNAATFSEMNIGGFVGNHSVCGYVFANGGTNTPDPGGGYATPPDEGALFQDLTSYCLSLGGFRSTITNDDGSQQQCLLYCMAMSGYGLPPAGPVIKTTASDFNLYVAASRNNILGNVWQSRWSTDDYYLGATQWQIRVTNGNGAQKNFGDDVAWKLSFIMDHLGNTDSASMAACIKQIIYKEIGPIPGAELRTRNRIGTHYPGTGGLPSDPGYTADSWGWPWVVDAWNDWHVWGSYAYNGVSSWGCPVTMEGQSLWDWANARYINNAYMYIADSGSGQRMYVACGGPRMSVGLTSLVPPAQRYVTGTMTDTINLTSMAYDVTAGNWLSYGPGNTPIPVVIRSKLWGPYQTPQPEGMTPAGTPAGNKTYTYTSAGTYTTTFSPAEATAAATDGNMFKPGYYYWTYEMNAGDQTSENRPATPIDGYIQSKYITNYGVKIGAVEANEWTVQQF